MLTEEIDWGKVFNLASCALGIAALPETLGIGAVLAFINCGKAAADYWTE